MAPPLAATARLTMVDAAVEAIVVAKPAPIAPVERTGTAWPFHKFDRAIAVTFNHYRHEAPGSQLFAYDEHGWNPSIVERRPVDNPMTDRAVALLMQTGGAMEVSKCPLPRHAVVFYDGPTPVASINVCFQCGDILAWPRWPAQPNWDNWSQAQFDAWSRTEQKRLVAYKTVFPQWQAFFRDLVGFPINENTELYPEFHAP